VSRTEFSLQIDALQAENARLQGEHEADQHALDDARARIRRLEEAVRSGRAWRERANHFEAELGRLKIELDQALRRHDELFLRATDPSDSRTRWVERWIRTDASSAAKTELERSMELRRLRARLEPENARLQARNHELERAVLSAKTAQAGLEAELARLRSELGRANAALAETRAAAARAAPAIQPGSSESARRELAATLRDLDALEAEIGRMPAVPRARPGGGA
jgi:chromosome segregation ATPase